jgi:hypothetical protein
MVDNPWQRVIALASLFAVAVLFSGIFFQYPFSFIGPGLPKTVPFPLSYLLVGVSCALAGSAFTTWRQRSKEAREAKVRTMATRAAQQASAGGLLRPFISYSHADKEFAEKLEVALSYRGIRSWRDEKNLRPGHDILAKLVKAIAEFDRLLLCCSKHSLTSWWVDQEVTTAIQKEESLATGGQVTSVVIPLNLDGFLFDEAWTKGFKPLLRRRFASDFTMWQLDSEFEKQVDRLVLTLSPNGQAAETRSLHVV